MLNKKRILNNLITARAAIETHSPLLFDLGQFKSNKSCGTLYCSAGLLATIPHFFEQGIEYHGDMVVVKHNNRSYGLTNPLTDKVFGQDSYHRLFAVRGHGKWDFQLQPSHFTSWMSVAEKKAQFSDKELAIARLSRQIDIIETDMDIVPYE